MRHLPFAAVAAAAFLQLAAPAQAAAIYTFEADYVSRVDEGDLSAFPDPFSAVGPGVSVSGQFSLDPDAIDESPLNSFGIYPGSTLTIFDLPLGEIGFDQSPRAFEAATVLDADPDELTIFSTFSADDLAPDVPTLAFSSILNLQGPADVLDGDDLPSQAQILSLSGPATLTLGYALLLDEGGDAPTVLANRQVIFAASDVAPVPLPATGVLLVAALAAAAGATRARRRAA
ncbi:MAG: hypothetical protein AAF763_09180 [Pseudomonadota bacterium]